MGQCVGDSLGALVEFSSPEEIRQRYPEGMQNLEDGGHWNLIAGQPTDDTEMALALARCILEEGTYSQEKARKAYLDWCHSNPFDMGRTITTALMSGPHHSVCQESQANGALMRVSPIAILGAGHDYQEVAKWAMQDAELTHPHRVCKEVNALFAMAIAYSMSEGPELGESYDRIVEWSRQMSVDKSVSNCIADARLGLPNTMENSGWVLIAFQIALYHMLHTEKSDRAVIDTVEMGGDTDTNGAICGAMIGSINGINLFPFQWKRAVRECSPTEKTSTHHPRPQEYWP